MGWWRVPLVYPFVIRNIRMRFGSNRVLMMLVPHFMEWWTVIWIRNISIVAWASIRIALHSDMMITASARWGSMWARS